MGRYSSVQAYADNNANVRKVAYEQVAVGASNESKGFGKLFYILRIIYKIN